MSDETKEAVIDGEAVELTYRQGNSLLAALRRNGYYSVKDGCDDGVCGACNVLLGGTELRKSCTISMDEYSSEEITTAAGLVASDGSLHPVQEELLDNGAVQCGFCIPGLTLSAVKLLRETEDPSREDIRAALSTNICRCGGYVQQVEAVEAAAEQLQRDSSRVTRGD